MLKRSVIAVAMVFVAAVSITLAGCGHSGPTESNTVPIDDVDALMQMLASETPEIRSVGARRLGNLGAAADPAVPKLQELANGDPDEGVRKLANDALQKIQGG